MITLPLAKGVCHPHHSLGIKVSEGARKNEQMHSCKMHVLALEELGAGT